MLSQQVRERADYTKSDFPPPGGLAAMGAGLGSVAPRELASGQTSGT